MVFLNCARARIGGEVYGAVGNLSQGIFLDAACNFVRIEPSGVDQGAFIAANQSAAFKVRFDNRDARGDAAFAAAGNMLVGVTG